jgi:hypothetical protein
MKQKGTLYCTQNCPSSNSYHCRSTIRMQGPPSSYIPTRYIHPAATGYGLTSQWLCGHGDKYYFPRLATNYLQCLFPLRLQKNGVTLEAPNWHTAWSRCSASTFNYIKLLLQTVRYVGSIGSMWEFQVCKKEKEVRSKVARSSLFARYISQNYVSLWGLHLHALWWLYIW